MAVICEWLHADDTFCLGLELLRVEISFGKAVDDHLADDHLVHELVNILLARFAPAAALADVAAAAHAAAAPPTPP